MSCPRRRPEGSGYQKPSDAALAAANEKALASLMAARYQQDEALYGAWAAATDCSDSSPPASSTPGADIVEVDGHYYRFPDVEHVKHMEENLTNLIADRCYNNIYGSKEPAHHYFSTTDISSGSITHIGGDSRSMRTRRSESTGTTSRLTAR
jgi:hypothetical protein